MLKRWIRGMLDSFGVQIVRSSSLKTLHAKNKEFEVRLRHQTQEIGDLRAGNGALQAQLGQANSQLGALQTSNAESATALAGLTSQLGSERKFSASSEQRVRRLMAQLARAPGGSETAAAGSVSASSQRIPEIVVVVTTVSQLPQLKALTSTATIKDAYDFIVAAYFDVKDSGLAAYCEANGIGLLDHHGKVVCGDVLLETMLPSDEPITPYFGLAGPVEDVEESGKLVVDQANQLLAEIHWHHSVGEQIHRLMHRLRPSGIVLFEDNAAYHTGAWVAIARRVDIPVVVLPYAIIDPRDAAEAHLHEPAYWAEHGALNRAVRRSLPHWVFSHRGRELLRRPAAGALAAEVLGVAQPRPWVWNSTRSDILAVESEAMREVYLAQGLSMAQIEVTGSVADDLLFAALTNGDAVRRELGLDPDRRTLVCGFPPDQLSVNRPEPEFRDFRAIVERWLGEFSKLDGWQVVIKAHPAMHQRDVAYIREFGLPVTDKDTTALVAVCDLFNTSVSSTIRWALACGKPVLNYDVYRYRYQDFVNEPAVLTVYDFDEFSRQLSRLTRNAAALSELTETARASSARWGRLDGHSSARIAAVLDRMTGRNALPGASSSQ